MLSPKMQRPIRVNETQIQMLAERARYDPAIAGSLYKRTADGSKWQLRWFTLYQNMLFYSESESSNRPSGVIFLEGSYCDRLIVSGNKSKPSTDKQYCFAITYRRESQRSYELKADSESDCKAWIEAIRQASFNKLLLQKEELEQKHLHLLQIVESEKTAKWQYTQQCEELTDEIKKLRAELCALKKEWKLTPSQATNLNAEVESEDLKKIRKVQGFFRGWLCRHRWKLIVEQYIKSPHAESMRKRNSLVFRMVEDEEEYVGQLEVLVSCFLRPFKMAASSKKPLCSHEDVSSIFLNMETVLFLHQIFLKGLQARMSSWPTLVLGDLFDMLLPMLNIYQEYVRNHHFSLQVLTECKQNPQFAVFLSRLENKPACKGRSLETFLTYPMHQIPRYIITLHELLAHTPHDHVERRSLENARIQLEDLSRQMHDEVSETENIRKNLAIERMIIEGCDILMDVNQVFVRQGSLLHIVPERSRLQRGKLSGGNRGEREEVRQCFLFSNHLILATRTTGGKLHLVANVGKIPLADATLIEDPAEHNSNDDDGESSICSMSSQSSGISESSTATSSGASSKVDYHGLDFQIIVENKTGGNPTVVHLVAPSMQDKTAWISDISQCMDNVHFNDFVHSTVPEASLVTQPQSIRNDPRLFNDDVDIRFSRTLNSCKVPQIRYATPERLLERLTDLRFLSIDFLNTFLLTYRVFTDSVTVLDALKKVFYSSADAAAEMGHIPSISARSSVASIDLGASGHGPREREHSGAFLTTQFLEADRDRRRSLSPRRTSSGSNVSGYYSETYERERSHSRELQQPATSAAWWRRSRRREEEAATERRRESSPATGAKSLVVSLTLSSPSGYTSSPRTSPRSSPFTSPRGSTQLTLRPGDSSAPPSRRGSRLGPIENPEGISETEGSNEPQDDGNHLAIPKGIGSSSSADTLTEASGASSPTTLSTSTHTLVAFNIEGSDGGTNAEVTAAPRRSASETRKVPGEAKSEGVTTAGKESETSGDDPESSEHQDDIPPLQQYAIRRQSLITGQSDSVTSASDMEVEESELGDGRRSSHQSRSFYSVRRFGRRQQPDEVPTRNNGSPGRVGVGVVITSHRQSQRRSSTSSAASAFAVATAGSSNPRDHPPLPRKGSSRYNTRVQTPSGVSAEPRGSFIHREPSMPRRKESVMSTAATMRVLNVLRHWISKHHQDFTEETRLKNLTMEFLEDVLSSPQLLPAEHKAASQLLRLLTREEPAHGKVDLNILLSPPPVPTKESIETLSALEIAEQMTYLDHKIFVSIRSCELLGQAWMKPDKATRAYHIYLITRRFNDVSRLVASEVIRRQNLAARIAVIDKWTAVADICRCLHNFNGVLQICSALTNSAVFRLKKTTEKLSKTTRQTIEKLQNIVSSDGRFRNLRDALHRCDPPCIPYLGMYLSDLSFIEEGTPTFTEDGLLNFSKMRMVAHVIREIRHFQATPYKIEHVSKVTNYLLDTSLLLDDEELYRLSLDIEPRQSRLGSISQQGAPLPNTGNTSSANPST